MPIFSKNDVNILGVIRNNKVIAGATLSWIFLFSRDNPPMWALELLADYILLDDYKDVGQFDHVHHWMTGYIFKALTRSKKLPEKQRNAQLVKDLSSMFNSRKRQKFMRR